MADPSAIKTANTVFVQLKEWDEESKSYVESIVACKNDSRPIEEIEAEFHKPPLRLAKAYRP